MSDVQVQVFLFKSLSCLQVS